MAHWAIQCPVNAPTPTPTLTLAHITTPFNKQAVSSLDSPYQAIQQNSEGNQYDGGDDEIFL